MADDRIVLAKDESVTVSCGSVEVTVSETDGSATINIWDSSGVLVLGLLAQEDSTTVVWKDNGYPLFGFNGVPLRVFESAQPATVIDEDDEDDAGPFCWQCGNADSLRHRDDDGTVFCLVHGDNWLPPAMQAALFAAGAAQE